MKYYAIIYRTGGWKNFEWKKTINMTLDEATIKAVENIDMGYPSYILDIDLLEKYGFPDTFEYDFMKYIEEI